MKQRDRGGWLGLAAALSVMLAAAGASAASAEGNAALARWKIMDLCAKQAQQAFPDYTAASNAARDAKLKECLANNNLPPREPLSPPLPGRPGG
jgi:hypothetical protein